MSTDLKLIALYDKLHSEIEAVETIRGEKGDAGPQEPQGEKGSKGDTGASGKDGKDGAKGKDGKDGKDGRDGEDGVSVVDANLDIDNHLVITLSDGKEVDAGSIEGLGGKGSGNLQVISSSSGIQTKKETFTWVDYVTNWSSTPTFLETIAEGDVYEYPYENDTLYRVISSSPYTDKFYSSFANSEVNGFVISRGISI